MINRIVVLFLCFVASSCLDSFYYSGAIVRVADGDTFTMLVDGAEQRVRLFGIDCPERGQPYSRVATEFTRELLASGPVAVQEMDVDQYGRVVGVVWISDSINLNERLLDAGLAWHYTAFDRDPQWARLEREAKRAKRGLWAERGAIAPWEWRKRRRSHD